MSVKKYFIAIVIPTPLQQGIEKMKHDLFTEYGLKGALRSPAHITLHRPFEWKEEKEAQLIETLSMFIFEKSFDLQLKNFAFFEPRVIYIDVRQEALLFELHQQLKNFARKELGLLNEASDMRGFHPHVTVAFRDLKKPLFYKLQDKFKAEHFEGSFGYEGFSLLRFDKRWEAIKKFDQ